PYRVHGARLLAADPVEADPGREARRPSPTRMPARHLDLRRVRPQTRGDQVALPDRRVQARFDVGYRRPAAPADPTRDQTVQGGLPQEGGSRARVRPT